MGCQDVYPALLQKAFQMKVIDIHTHGIGGYDTRSEVVKLGSGLGISFLKCYLLNYLTNRSIVNS
jgi:hypothetical protein